MKLWPFKRTEGPSWGSLTAEQQQAVAFKLGGMLHDIGHMAKFAKGYEPVTHPYDEQRRQSFIEKKGEDDQLKARERNRLINLGRDMLRNSPARVGQDQQIRVNVVGSVGGKLVASFPDGFKDAADAVQKYFNKVWFPNAEFTYGKDFNWILKTQLSAQDTNGNVILVFDDGILTGGDGTGRIRGFEGDEIAEAPLEFLEKQFGKKAQQSQGFVYKNGMFAGLFCSTVQRGQKTLDPALGILTLKRDPFAADKFTNWVMLGHMQRFNQGRAASPLWAAITTMVDLHEISASEAQAAKLNAQLVGQILEDAKNDDDGDDAVTDAALTPPSAGGNAADAAKPKVVNFSTKHLKAIGAHFDKMPKGLKIELMDTKRPNPNMPAYIELLLGISGFVKGLTRVYATGKVQNSYTGYRGEQNIAEASFDEMRTNTEREVCDWTARCVISRAVKLGLITEKLPDGWEGMIAWRWPELRDVDETKTQTANKLKLANGLTSLHRLLGPGEYEKVIAERAKEAEDAKRLGLSYPGAAGEDGDLVPADNGGENDETTDKGGENAE